MSAGHDGQRENYYIVRTASFEPRPALTTEGLRAANVAGLGLWTVDELASPTRSSLPDVYLPELVAALLADGSPARAIDAGV